VTTAVAFGPEEYPAAIRDAAHGGHGGGKIYMCCAARLRL
jgi:hypothetical protein